MNDDILYYTYIDECKRNYLTTLMKENDCIRLEEYSITSITFESEYYKEKFEPKWDEFRKKYKIEGYKAIHFTDYLKLINKDREINERIKEEYSLFFECGEFSIELLKEFFNDLKSILQVSEFFLVHNDFYWEPEEYILNNRKEVVKKKSSRIIAPHILRKVPYLAMKNQLDMLMQCLLRTEFKDNINLFDENKYKRINTKLRFDADGKQFDARADLKRAYNHTIAVGSDLVKSEVAVEILDEIRFIRKEEVGHDCNPNHCGLEVVDFLCSLISGETRLKEYKNKGIISNELNNKMNSGDFINLKFEDGDVINFDFILDKIRYKNIKKLFDFNKI